MLDIVAKLGKPTYDSEESNDEPPADLDDEVTEWVAVSESNLTLVTVDNSFLAKYSGPEHPYAYLCNRLLCPMVTLQGEKDGYHYRVPKKFVDEGKRMSDIELLNDVIRRKEELAKMLERERKVRATSGTGLGRFRTYRIWPYDSSA